MQVTPHTTDDTLALWECGGSGHLCISEDSPEVLETLGAVLMGFSVLRVLPHLRILGHSKFRNGVTTQTSSWLAFNSQRLWERPLRGRPYRVHPSRSRFQS